MADEDRRNFSVQRILLGRMGEPADMAAAVLFLASDEASFMTGQMMIIDGGRTIA